MYEILAGVGMARDFDIPVEVTDRARIRELWPSAVVDDLVGGVLFPIGRDGQPGRRGARVREGRRRGAACATSRTPTVTGFRFAAGPPARRRPRHVARRHRGGDRGPGRRAVDQRAGPAGGRQRRALPGRARLGHDRGGVGRGRGCAVPARPGRLMYIRHYRGRYRHRRVRAERQADRAIGRAVDRVRGIRA